MGMGDVESRLWKAINDLQDKVADLEKRVQGIEDEAARDVLCDDVDVEPARDDY